MKKLLAIILALCLLTGCAVNTSAEPDSAASYGAPSVGVHLVDVGKTQISFTVTVSVPPGDKPARYGYAIYSNFGSLLGHGDSDSADFTVDGLRDGTRYCISGWVDVAGDRYVVTSQCGVETLNKYDAPLSFGIDVSKWQGGIDWNAVAGSGIEFAILRIGYTGGADSRFEEYYTGASAAGLKLGVYQFCYAESVDEARVDAQAVLNMLDGRPLTYPIYYDVEDEGEFLNLKTQERMDIIAAFCEEIEAAGYKAGVYMGRTWLYDYFDGDALRDGYDLWIAETTYDPPDSSGFPIMQYSHTGSVAGVNGDVDLNAAYINY